MNDSRPEYVAGAWTCPPGYAFGRCERCGHTFYDFKPVRIRDDGTVPEQGLCQWCVDEVHE